MEKRSTYIAADGSHFDDPEKCLAYERLLRRWEQAIQQFAQAARDLGYVRFLLEDLDHYTSNWEGGEPCDDDMSSSLRFLKFQAVLQ
jgi:hypothetical protein